MQLRVPTSGTAEHLEQARHPEEAKKAGEPEKAFPAGNKAKRSEKAQASDLEAAGRAPGPEEHKAGDLAVIVHSLMPQ